jgi:predicted acetyltransferase
MPDCSTKPAAQIEVAPATAEQASILANLLQLYAHDFSEFLDMEIGADGRFVYKQLPLYWREPSRNPYLVWADGKLAGFVLVQKGSEVSGATNVWDMTEFFVLRRYRRRRIGTEVAQKVWGHLPGTWEVRVMQLNVAAQRFWARTISEFIGKAIDPVGFEKNGESWILYSFEAGSTASNV